MNRNHVLEMWLKYRQILVHGGASSVQVEETCKAFYAGAMALMTLLERGVSDGPDMQPQDMDLVRDIHTEFDAFLELLGSTGHVPEAAVWPERGTT